MKCKISIFILWTAFVLISTLIIPPSSGLCAGDSGPAATELDAEPASNQLPYAPADGGTVKVNPPPFIWVPVSGATEYMLEIGRDDNFKSGAEVSLSVPYSTYALRSPLQRGEWYWRYGVRIGESTTYSKSRKFIVPFDAPEFPFPNVEDVLASVSEARPRLFVPHKELQSYRRRAKDGDLREIISGLLAECDRHLGEEIIAEPPYVPKSGPTRNKIYLDVFLSTRPPMDIMEQCALAYLLTEDRRYGMEAKRRLRHFFGWDPHGSTAYENNDEPAMWVMMRGIRAYDWTHDLFTPGERDAIETTMKIRATQFYRHLRERRKYHSDPYESHANRTLGFLGEVCLSFAHEWPEVREWFPYVLTMYWNIFPAWGREDGGWHEGPNYWNAYMDFVLHFITSLRKATGVNLFGKPFFHNTPYYKLYTNPPYSKIMPYGDGEEEPPDRYHGHVMYRFSTLLDDPYLRWYADFMNSGSGEDILGVVLKNDRLRGTAPVDLPQARYFPGVGLASLHTNFGDADNDVHFLFRSDPYGTFSHAHPDQNAFTIEAFGEALAIASGFYPWYLSPHHLNWTHTTKAHNCITFDGGLGQERSDPEAAGKIIAFEHSDIYDYILGDAARAYKGKLNMCLRHVVHLRPGVFIIYDEVEAPRPVGFEWWLHTMSEMRINESEKSIIISQNDAMMNVQFLKPQEIRFTQFKGFPDPPERTSYDQWHTYAETPGKLSSTEFLTILTPYKKGRESDVPGVTLSGTNDSPILTITRNGRTYKVAFKPNISVERLK